MDENDPLLARGDNIQGNVKAETSSKIFLVPFPLKKMPVISWVQSILIVIAGGSAFSRLWRTDWVPCIPARYAIAVVGCLGFVNVYALRVNLSVTIIQMVNATATPRNGSARVCLKIP